MISVKPNLKKRVFHTNLCKLVQNILFIYYNNKKNYLRSTMAKFRYSYLMELSIEAEITI
jgi:hypothetical protein